MYGWTGRTVIVDLAQNSVTETRTRKKYAEHFIGGRGLGSRMMQDMAEPDMDPLDPQSPIIFTTGPLTGTAAPMSGHFSVTCKSPLTSTIFSTNVGGHFGPEMKFAGLDALVIKGRAKGPVYLHIYDEEVEILPADHLWGKNSTQTTELLGTKGKVACIGRAGENLVSFANITNDSMYSSGRGGHGAVCGSKMLKALVVKGTNEVEIAYPDDFEKTVQKTKGLLIANPPASKGLAVYGSSAFMDILDSAGIIPANNFKYKHFSRARELSGENVKIKYGPYQTYCHACPIGCIRLDEHGTPVPDFDSIWAFGPNIGNDDIEIIRDMGRLCFEYGLDPLSCGSSIASYMEVNPWVQMDELKGIIMKIGSGGHDLCKGAHAYLCTVGKEGYSTSVKNLEIPGYDPREIAGMAIAYATSNTGGSHLSAFMPGPELIGKPILLDRKSSDGKPALVQYFQNLTATLDSLVMCPFAMMAIGEDEFAEMIGNVTGKVYSTEDVLRSGERIYNLERIFNIKAGYSVKEDTLPDRFFGTDGVDREALKKSIKEYYHFRGWDELGVPTSEKLKDLQIDAYHNDLSH